MPSDGRQRAAAVLSPVDIIAKAFEAKPGGKRVTQELAVSEGTGIITLDLNPRLYVAQASKLAAVLSDVIKQRKLFAVIDGRAYVTVEGWTLLANMLGVHPIVVWSRRLSLGGQTEEEGWEARVEVRNRAGEIIGAGEAMCSRGEKRWASRDEYALRGMAQTRAISRALRNPLGFVVKLSGYEPTPAEEMKEDGK